ncbi:lipoprotein NlpI [compost metagenome]
MKLFGFNKKSTKEKFQIHENNRKWTEDNFEWLIGVFGYPDSQKEQILLTEHYFPKTFRADSVCIENIIVDLSEILAVPENKVAFIVLDDLRDAYGLPYEMYGKPFETELEIQEDVYHITIANSLHKHPKRLIHNLVYEFVKIKLHEDKLEFDTGKDTRQFVFLAGIFLGFGVLFIQNLRESGISNDGVWETKWHYISEIPSEIMVFGLALYAKLSGQESPEWKNELPKELKPEFEKALILLKEHPSRVYDEVEFIAQNLFIRSCHQSQNQQFEEAISSLRKILPLTKNQKLIADTYNNIGYSLLRLKKYEESISYFKQALEIAPNYGYANDNLGYAFIRIGELSEGKKWLDQAFKTENNDPAYSFRNLALYHQQREEIELAEVNFLKAFEAANPQVDLLEYHYAEFLFLQGKTDEGMKYLKLAVEKDEPEAIQRMNELLN